MRFPTTLLLLFYQLCCYHSVVVVVLGSDNFPGSTSTEDGWSDEEEGGSKLMPSKNDDNMPQVVYPRQMMMKYFPRFTGYNNPIVESTTTTRNHRFSSSYNNLFRESVVVVDHTDNSKNTNIKMHYIQDAPVDKVWNYYTQPPLDYNHHNPKKDAMIEIGVSGPESTDNMIPSYNNNYGIPQRNEPPPSVEHFATNIPHSTVTDNEFIFNYENHLFENTSYNNVFDTLFQSGKDNNVHPQKIRFVPLSCNSKLQSVRCGSWVAKYGTASTHRKLIVIPCGQCITMDYYSTSGSSTNPPLLILEAGIDIVGKLVFPNNYRINLRTSMIVVQGELQMTSRKPVDGTPDIAILMIGNRNETFAAQYESKNICPNNRCLAGKKAITVAGGKITGTL